MKDELEEQRVKNTMHEINLRTVITLHHAVDDWEQNGPDSWTCYLAVGHFLHGETQFEASSLEDMLEVLLSNAIEVVDNP